MTLLLYLIILAFAIQIQAQNQQQNQTQSNNYQVFELYKINQIQQVNNTQSFVLNLSRNEQILLSNGYLVIDIDLITQQSPNSQFIACLNFKYDIQQDVKFQNSGAYSCQYQDADSTQQQVNQHLIVIKTNNDNFKNYSKAYLTVFYLDNPNEFLSASKQLKSPIDYVVVTYFSNWIPCHNNCNNQNGSCNQKTGQCQCIPFFFNVDCGLSADSLTFNQNYDSNQITVFQQKTQYFYLNLTQISIISKQNPLTLFFKQISKIAMIDIFINFNQQILPSDETSDVKYAMSNSSLEIQNLQNLCNNFSKKNKNNTGLEYVIQNQCFLILAVRQNKSTPQYSLIDVQIQFQPGTNQNDSSSNNNSKNNNDISSQSNQNSSKSVSPVELTIILFCTLAGMCLLIVILRILKKKLKQLNQSTNIIVNNLQTQALAQDLFNYGGCQAEKDKIKNLIIEKKRVLQELFMPVILLQYNASQSIICKIDIQNESCSNSKSQIKSEQLNDIEQQQKPKVRNNTSPNDKESKQNQSLQFKSQEIKKPSLTESQINAKQTCSICLAEFSSQEQIRQTICNHTFHQKCLDDWVIKNDSCPLCRQDFQIKGMIEFLTQRKLEQLTDQFEKDHVNSIKDQILSQFKKKETYELQVYQFLDMIKKNLIDQLSINQAQSQKDIEARKQKELQDKEQKNLCIINKQSSETHYQTQSFSPIKISGTIFTDISPDNLKDSQFNITLCLNQDLTQKNINSMNKLQNLTSNPETPKSRIESRLLINSFQNQSKFKLGSSDTQRDVVQEEQEEEKKENNQQENKGVEMRSNSENLEESNSEQITQKNIQQNSNSIKVQKINFSFNHS